MVWSLYDNGLHHERVKETSENVCFYFMKETSENACFYFMRLVSFGVCIQIQYFCNVVRNKLQTINNYLS